MDGPTAEPPPPPPPHLSELILSLEQATLMAKELPSTTNPTHLNQIHTSLHYAHQHLSTFLSTLQFPPPLMAAENSLSSANGAAAPDGREPMQIGDDDDDGVVEETSKYIIDEVEEKMRDCFIKNKRPKRPLSPSAAAFIEEKRLSDDGFVGRVKNYDPHAMRIRALDLVYQFHG
ncbi:unnamed protein product [Lupinus luteus]|uniref:Uncharacterized protein n=1 Tax=Lupinus luteus TaxID=3873 RepID=A0AAV1Y2B0_LUPLU